MQSSLDEATALLGHAEELHRNGRNEAAAAIATSIVERTGDPGTLDDDAAFGEQLALLRLRLGSLLRLLGMPERAAPVLSRAAERFGKSAAFEAAGRRAAALRENGLALRDLGRLDDAEAALREALDGDLSFAEAEAIVASLVELADVLAALGKYASAAKCYEWALQQAMALDDREVEAVVRHGYGELLLAAGRADIAFLRFWRAFHLFRMIGDDDGLACAARGMGDVALGGGRGGEARDSFLQMMALGQQNNKPSIEALALARRAAGFRVDGMLGDAESALRKAIEILEPREHSPLEVPERLAPFVPPPIDVLAACAHDLGLTLALRGKLDLAEDSAHRALQMRARRKHKDIWRTNALLGRIARLRGDESLARVWYERAGAAYRPVPALVRAGHDLEMLVDALRPLFAMAQAARRSIDVWIGEALPFGGPIAHEPALRTHLEALADPTAAAPIPDPSLPEPLKKALREAWKLGPWPEDDLIPEPADD
ncbi:MAG: tetratricopeptide repeat protein [Polyangiaceae bacterium]